MAFFFVRRISPRLATIAVAIVAGMAATPLTPHSLAERDLAQPSQDNIFTQVGKSGTTPSPTADQSDRRERALVVGVMIFGSAVHQPFGLFK